MDSENRPHHAAAAGPGLFELGGKTFVLSPMTGPDWLALHAEFRRQCIASARDPLAVVNERIAAAEKAGKPLSPTLVNAMVAAAMSAAGRTEGKAEPSEQEISARVNTLEGSRYLIFHRLRKADHEVTAAWVAEHVPDMETRNRVFSDFARADGLEALDPKKASPTG